MVSHSTIISTYRYCRQTAAVHWYGLTFHAHARLGGHRIAVASPDDACSALRYKITHMALNRRKKASTPTAVATSKYICYSLEGRTTQGGHKLTQELRLWLPVI